MLSERALGGNLQSGEQIITVQKNAERAGNLLADLEDRIREELKDCSSEELWLIYDTQKDLYSDEELSVIRQMAQQKNLRENAEQEQNSRLSAKKMTVCEKCGTVNDPDAKRCLNCGYKLKAKKDSRPKSKLQTLFTTLYILSFLIPPSGMIIGIILISWGETERHDAGQKCFELSLFSAVLMVVALFLYLFWIY